MSVHDNVHGLLWSFNADDRRVSENCKLESDLALKMRFYFVFGRYTIAHYFLGLKFCRLSASYLSIILSYSALSMVKMISFNITSSCLFTPLPFSAS